jgi:predicted nucleic acid-binding protein
MESDYELYWGNSPVNMLNATPDRLAASSIVVGELLYGYHKNANDTRIDMISSRSVDRRILSRVAKRRI